jgi:hypothetical protein
VTYQPTNKQQLAAAEAKPTKAQRVTSVAPAAAPDVAPTSISPYGIAVSGAVAVAGLIWALKKVYNTPSRSYDGNVGEEYGA